MAVPFGAFLLPRTSESLGSLLQLVFLLKKTSATNEQIHILIGAAVRILNQYDDR